MLNKISKVAAESFIQITSTTRETTYISTVHLIQCSCVMVCVECPNVRNVCISSQHMDSTSIYTPPFLLLVSPSIRAYHDRCVWCVIRQDFSESYTSDGSLFHDRTNSFVGIWYRNVDKELSLPVERSSVFNSLPVHTLVRCIRFYMWHEWLGVETHLFSHVFSHATERNKHSPRFKKK